MVNTERKDDLYGTVLQREGVIDSWQAEIWVTTLDANLRDGVRKPGPMITLFGAFTVAVDRVRKFSVCVQPGVPIIGSVTAPAVGAIVSTFKVVEAMVTLSPEEYQTVLALVTTGNLLQVSCTFVKPVEGSAKILAITMSTTAQGGSPLLNSAEARPDLPIKC